MSKKDNGTMSTLLVLFGIALTFADSPNLIILFLTKVVGIVMVATGCYMMGEQDGAHEDD